MVKVVACSAETGLDILTELLNTDEGSRYLGEVALVPYNSPISNSNIIFIIHYMMKMLHAI